MSERKTINVNELRRVFRIRNGNLERLNPHFKGGKWTIVENKSNDSKGYCVIWLNGKNIFYHNVIWVLSTGNDIKQGLYIDHINGICSDNRMENLRLVTRRENNQNKKVHRDGKLCGITIQNSKYKAQIQINGKQIYLGYYDTEQEAHKAYKIACEHIEQYIDNDSFRGLVKKVAENMQHRSNLDT